MDLDELVLLLGRRIDEGSASAVAIASDLKRAQLDLSANGSPETQFFVEAKSIGFQARCDISGLIQTIFLMASNVEGFSQYPWPLVDGIDLSASQVAVERAFGLPQFRRPATTVPVLGRFGEAVRYDFPSHAVHFEFDLDTHNLRMVTISARTS